MAFAGGDAALNVLLRDAVINEVQALGGYTARPVSREEHPEILGLPPEKPPAPGYVGSARYALTGKFYIEPDEERGRFQLWLWNSGDGSLVYTDESVARTREETLSYMPVMVSWIFSHIPQEGQSPPLGAAVTTAPRGAAAPRGGAADDLFDRWLYVGLRGGGSFRFYTLSESAKDYHSAGSNDFSYEGSIQAACKFLPFMSVQAEVVFTQDRAKFQGSGYYNDPNNTSWQIFYTDNYTSTSFLFPLTVKFPLVFDPYIISPFGGAYVTLPLGRITRDSNIAVRNTGDFDHNLTGYFGLTAGVDLGMKLGPGIFFLDLRYGSDLGETLISLGEGNTVRYRRAMLSISVGYELALLSKKAASRR
jgi:hypothetical protein